MSNLPTAAPRATYIDPQTAEEVKNGGPASQPYKPPLLKLRYNVDADVVEIEGMVFHCEMFRQFGWAMPLETPLKIVGRDEGALTVVQMEPGDPDWRGETCAAGASAWVPIAERLPAENEVCLVSNGHDLALTRMAPSALEVAGEHPLAWMDLGFTPTHWAHLSVTLPGDEPKPQ